MALPDATGHFGPYGGRFVPEALVAALDELDDAFRKAWVDDAFRAELDGLLRDYTGRPTPITSGCIISVNPSSDQFNRRFAF